MSRAKNTIKASDISTTPIKLEYIKNYTSQSFTSYGITINSGSNGTVTITGSVPQLTINYRTIRQLYYQNYLTGSLLVSTSSWDWNQQSTACSGSVEYENRYFPTQSNAKITYINIPRTVFGEQIKRSTFTCSGDGITVFDDGNGNLIDSTTHVGNIIYSQGVIIFTNPTYLNFVTASNAILTINSVTTAYENEYRCHISENDFNYTQNPSANKAGTTGSYIDAVTGSDFRPYATSVGLYNERDELLVVGKLSMPYPIPPNTDMTFVVRWDS